MADINDSFSLENTDYLSFDAKNMKDLLLRNLNANGSFPDSQFEGSNWSALTDMMASFFGMYMFYLNRTAAEHTFTSAQLYENMSRMVGAFNYSVGGKQTSILPFIATNKAGSTLTGTYTIPRYTSFNLNGIQYSFNKDISFTVEGAAAPIPTLYEKNSLYQGVFAEYPAYTALGEDYEKITMNVVDTTDVINIDHFNIHVYVKSVETGKWRQWKRVETLYLEKGLAEVFEARLNPKKKYEIRFGDGVNGKRLATGDTVAIYYLKSDMKSGEIGSGILDGVSPSVFSTTRFLDIMYSDNGISKGVEFISPEKMESIIFQNKLPSSSAYEGEGVEDIRRHAPKFTRYKNFTAPFIETFVDKNFKAIAYSTKVVGNKEFLEGHYAYMLNMNQGVSSRFLQNTNLFATSASFNNIYIYCVPNQPVVDSLGNAAFVLSNQKNFMLENMLDISIPTANFVFQDPVYMEFNFGLIENGDIEVFDAIDETRIVIVADAKNKRNAQAITSEFYSIIEDSFNYKNNSLGGQIDYVTLNYKLKNIEGVKKIVTIRERDGVRTVYEGISLLAMSRETPKEDFAVVNSNLTLPYWKFPYFNTTNLRKKVSVEYGDEKSFV